MRELRGHFKGTAIVGCSTSGEIVGDTVVDDSVIATAVEFEHTRLRTTSAKIGEAKSSWWARSSRGGWTILRCATCSCSRTANVNGSDLARGLASGVSEGVSITGGLSGDGTDFAETWVIDNAAAGAQRIAAVGLYGDHLRVGYASMGGWKPFGPLRTITRAEGNVLNELDGHSALSVQDISGPCRATAGIWSVVPDRGHRGGGRRCRARCCR